MTEAICALKGLEGAFAALIARERYNDEVYPGTISIDCDHAALFIFSAAITSINGKTAADPSATAKLRDWDIYNSTKYRQRQLATNIYRTGDNRFYHLHGSLNATPSQTMVGVDPSAVDITDEQEILDMYGRAVARFNAEELDRLANEEYKQAGTICYTTEGALMFQQINYPAASSDSGYLQNLLKLSKANLLQTFRYTSFLVRMTRQLSQLQLPGHLLHPKRHFPASRFWS